MLKNLLICILKLRTLGISSLKVICKVSGSLFEKVEISSKVWRIYLISCDGRNKALLPFAALCIVFNTLHIAQIDDLILLAKSFGFLVRKKWNPRSKKGAQETQRRNIATIKKVWLHVRDHPEKAKALDMKTRVNKHCLVVCKGNLGKLRNSAITRWL